MSNIKRYPDQGWISGVCAGIAEYFDWNVKVLRVLVVVAFCFSGFFPVGLVYALLWYVLDPATPGEGGRYRDYGSSSAPRPSPNGGGAPAGEVRARFARLEQRLRNLEECVSSRDFELRRELRKLET